MKEKADRQIFVLWWNLKKKKNGLEKRRTELVEQALSERLREYAPEGKRTGNGETLKDWFDKGWIGWLKYAGGEREPWKHGKHASVMLLWVWQAHL